MSENLVQSVDPESSVTGVPGGTGEAAESDGEHLTADPEADEAPVILAPSETGEPEIVELEPQTVAVLRETVPMIELVDYFGRAYTTVSRVVSEEGAAIVGPPVGLYFGTPTHEVDVAAGFPTDRPVTGSDGVSAETLPGGRAVQILHTGTYDAMEATYGRLSAWLADEKLTPGPVMWETYLTEPDPAAPENAQTLITWPVQ
ncbi:MAG TPA: GyrI-like domain-containing protein [Propionibacteriaceae bacterium]|nr:GyrI-like domain-containing protein [Propionibacteriaceae bacterium]